MKRKSWLIILTVLGILTLVWPLSYAIVRDFYPELKGFREVLAIKSLVNGLAFVIAMVAHLTGDMKFKD